MSCIYFHSQSGEAMLRGSERAMMGGLCSDIFLASVGPIFDYMPDRPHWSRRLLPTGCYVHRDRDNYARTLETYLKADMGGGLLIDGKERDIFTIALNTALVAGSDIVKLCARLHGQSEIHCFVNGPNRRWLADLMQDGRDCGIFREDQGWKEVIEFLRGNCEDSAVCSYSVCEQFPNASICGIVGDDERDAWYSLSEEDRWGMAFSKLDPWLELKPDNWGAYYFGDALNGFQLKSKALSVDSEVR